MEMEEDLLLTIQTSDKFVGTKQVLKGVSEGTIKCVVVAEDADGFIVSQVSDAARAAKVRLEMFPSKELLGKACGIDVAAAVVGLK